MQGAKAAGISATARPADLPNAGHVYLRPGLYAVKLSIRRAARRWKRPTASTSTGPLTDRARTSQYSLDEYLRIIEDVRSEDAGCGVVAADGARAGGQGPGAWPNQARGRRPQKAQAGRGPQPPPQPEAGGGAQGAGIAGRKGRRRSPTATWPRRWRPAGWRLPKDSAAKGGRGSAANWPQLIGPMARDPAGRLGDGLQDLGGARPDGSPRPSRRPSARSPRPTSPSTTCCGRRGQAALGGGRHAGSARPRPARWPPSLRGSGAITTPPPATARRPARRTLEAQRACRLASGG